MVNGLTSISKRLLSGIPSGLGSVAGAFTTFAFMTFILFFFFKDGRTYVARLQTYLPLSEKNKEHLSNTDKRRGGFYDHTEVSPVAIAQGLVGGIGFNCGGVVSSPVLMGFDHRHHLLHPLCRFLTWCGSLYHFTS